MCIRDRRQNLARVVGQLVNIRRRVEATRLLQRVVHGLAQLLDGGQADLAPERALLRLADRLLEDAAGDARDIEKQIKELTKLMKEAAQNLEFEQAVIYRDKIKALELLAMRTYDNSIFVNGG